MKPTDEAAVAGAAMPYGSPVKLADDGRLVPMRLRLSWDGVPFRDLYDDYEQMCGVLIRPRSANRNGVDILGCREGEAVKYRSAGHILAIDDAGHNISVILADGKVVS